MAGLVKGLRGRINLPVFRAVSLKSPIISRLAAINISQGSHSHIAITSSPICSRLSQVTVPGTQLLSRWFHNESKEAEKEIYNGILTT